MSAEASVTIAHSRYAAPTRRVACAKSTLTASNAFETMGNIAGFWAQTLTSLTQEQRKEVGRLLQDAQNGRFASSRLRHRIQTDTVGLSQTTVVFPKQKPVFLTPADNDITAPQLLLGIYCGVRQLPPSTQNEIFHILLSVTESPTRDTGTPETNSVSVRWARSTLQIPDHTPLSRDIITKAFRKQVKLFHPDMGADNYVAAQHLQQLREAKDALMKQDDRPTEN